MGLRVWHPVTSARWPSAVAAPNQGYRSGCDVDPNVSMDAVFSAPATPTVR